MAAVAAHYIYRLKVHNFPVAAVAAGRVLTGVPVTVMEALVLSMRVELVVRGQLKITVLPAEQEVLRGLRADPFQALIRDPVGLVAQVATLLLEVRL